MTTVLIESDAAAPQRVQERWWALFADTAYVLPIEDEDEHCYGIFDSDGTPLAVAPTRALAMAVIRRNGMRPADAH
jgi:hypothetical protein